MRKILIATDSWRPHMDGVVRHIDALIKEIKKIGVESVILHPRLFFSFSLPFYQDYRFTAHVRSKAKQIIKKEKPDHVHIMTSGPVGMAVRRICLENNIHFTTTYSTHFPNYAKEYILKSNVVFNMIYSYLKWFHNAGAKTMVSTMSLKEEVEKKGFKNVVVCPLGVDTEIFKSGSNKPDLLQKVKRPVFVYLGRIAKEKNVEEFLKCRLPGTKLIIGSGPLKANFEIKYSDAIFAGEKRGQELTDLLSASDVFVFPSVTETFGLVILEALSCGIPVAAHNVMGPKDIISQGIDGYMDDNLAKAALKCLDIPRENCRKKALKFSWKRSADIFIKNLSQV